MSTEGNRQTVLHKSKVRTALKGDSSWIQSSKGFEPEEDEKPWVAEVRASRLNGAGSDPVLDATSTEQEPQPSPSTDNLRTSSSGYLIRGVFTKTDTKSAQPSSANGHIGTSGFVKKPSDGYKKIAPHTVRPNIETTEQSDPSISAEEQDRRTEAASSILRNSGARQRSYVLSAAKKYESSEKPDSSAPPIASFVAKRVVISEDEDSDPAEHKAETPGQPSSSGHGAQQSYSEEMSVDEPAPPAVPVKQNVLPITPESKHRDKPQAAPNKSDDTPELSSVWKPVAQVTVATEAKKVSVPTPEPKAELTPTPSVTKSVTPVPVKSETPSTVPEAKPKPDATPKQSTATPIVPVAQKAKSTTPASKPEPTLKQSVTEPAAPTAPVAQKDTTKTPEPKPEVTPKQSVTQPAAPATPKDTTKTAEPKTPKQSVTEPVLPAYSGVQKTCQSTPSTGPSPPESVKPFEKMSDLNDVDLLDLTQSSLQKPAEPVPNTTDLLIELGRSLPQSEKTQGSLDLLALDVIPIDTTSDKLSTDKLNTKVETTQTIVQSKNSASSTETVTITTTKTKIVKESDEYSLPKSEKTRKSLDLLAADVIPIDTNMDKFSLDESKSKTETSKTIMYTQKDSKSSLPQSEKIQDSLLTFDVIPNKENTDKPSSDKTRSTETSQTVMLPKKDSKGTMELFDPLLLDSENMTAERTRTLIDDYIPSDTDTMSQKSKQQTVKVTFEEKSYDDGSPWDRWTSPTVHTTIKERQTKADPQQMTDSYTYSRMQDTGDQEPKSLDTDTKKSFVYVKEYVNLSELSAQNSISDGDYLTSTTTRYAYSSPSSVNMTACTYCGGLVGNDAKITIEHLNISCHPDCFKCGICSKPMGDFLDNMFLHRGTVHCENCYANVL